MQNLPSIHKVNANSVDLILVTMGSFSKKKKELKLRDLHSVLNEKCNNSTGLDKQTFSAKNCKIFSYASILIYRYFLGAQKNRLIDICFGREIRKLNFCYALLFPKKKKKIMEKVSRAYLCTG